MKSIYSCLIFNLFILSINGTIHYTDPTTEEIEYTDWAAGVRVIFCITDNLSIQEIDYAFKQAIVNVINLHCRNSTACGLEKRVKFVAHNILLLNGYPRRENRHYVFRFLIVLPLNSIPLEKLEKPLLHKRFSSSAFQNHIEDELTKKLGWKILSFESYPKYDEITVFMNSYLWLLGTIPCFLLAILGIFSAKLSSFEFGGGGDMIASGSKGGGKNTALTRTMEIIKNQQSFFDDIIKKQNIPDVGSDKENKYFENVKRGTKTTSTAPTG
uniref:Uncharacterized protein n=1 Tax=Rhabditophanes sp. KR3021 TaxID=114890 RepID=A0AC35UHC4_9BILA